MTSMKNDNASERAVALVQEAIDVLLHAEHAPDSPVNAFLPAKQRRQFRRAAMRLRQRKAQPRYKNLHSAEELADVYERTVERDEILDRAFEQFKRITSDLGRLIEDNGPEVDNAVETLVVEARRSAEEHGPGSEAARRYRYLQLLGWFGQQSHVRHRRQRTPPRWRFPLAKDPSIEARNQVIAAEILDSPPPGETVIPIPEEGKGSGRGRALLRIGLGEASWIGSFETGSMSDSTVLMMPDGKHLFVSAEGAGYIIDWKSRKLVETIGTNVEEVIGFPMRLFVVNHNVSLEAFGRNGRLWKTGRISAGGFRGIVVTETRLMGEARHPSRQEWAGFSVDLASGEVRFRS
ncbi:MAG: hypothetical protein QOE68_2074 [Thermoanaerobaculia bacterium]|jgi:hypothetical protein|nr:hypothetical protein [Thermoanaerobaculia bacterium]